jgi:hypothetical protein
MLGIAQIIRHGFVPISLICAGARSRDRAHDFQPSGITERHDQVVHMPGMLAQEPAIVDRGVGIHAKARRSSADPLSHSDRPGPIDLVQEQAPRDGEIQRVGDADNRDADEVRAEVTLQRREPPALLGEAPCNGDHRWPTTAPTPKARGVMEIWRKASGETWSVGGFFDGPNLRTLSLTSAVYLRASAVRGGHRYPAIPCPRTSKRR